MSYNTAAGAKLQAAKKKAAKEKDMVFASNEHKRFYLTKLAQAEAHLSFGLADVYHKAFLYTLGITRETREHYEQIFDENKRLIKPECMEDDWQTSTTKKVIRLAFNLFTDRTPSVHCYDNWDSQLMESEAYAISYIFSCGYAKYFWQAVQLRFPEYCHLEWERDKQC